MIRRATRGIVFVTKSHLQSLAQYFLPEETLHRFFPKAVDIIKEKQNTRNTYRQCLQALDKTAQNQKDNKRSSHLKEITLLTIEDVKSGELSVEDLMNVAKLNFHGEKKNLELAAQAWIQASKRGNTDASYSVAFCLLNGLGIKKDEEQAFRLMFPLANSYDNPYAHYALGNMYSKGMGTERNEKEAFQHYKVAAQADIPPAIFNLGNMYAAGVGVEQSDSNAIACYEGAIRYGDIDAKYILGTWLCEGRGVLAGEDSTEQRISNFDRGISLQVEAAVAGHARAAYNIGVFYLEGRNASGDAERTEGVVPQDLAAAAVWFEKASNLGMCEASFNLGMMYLEGSNEVPQDLYKARKFFTRGTEQNSKNEANFVLLEDVKKLIEEIEKKGTN